MAILWSAGYPQKGATTGTTAAFTLSANKAGSGYWVIVPSTDSNPTALNIIAGRDSTNQPLPQGKYGNPLLSSGVPSVVTATGLLSETSYKAFMLVSGVANGTSSGYRINYTTLDITAPLWRTGYPTTASISGVGGVVKISTNSAGSGYWVVVPAASGVPSAAQIKAGQNSGGVVLAAGKKGSGAISASGAIYSGYMTGLTGETSYKVYSIAQDSSVNLMASGRYSAFTTLDVTAPTWTAGYPTITPSLRTASMALKGNSNGTGYFVIVPRGASSPSTTQIKAGQNSAGSAVATGFSGSVSLVANTVAALNASNLMYATDYTVHMTQKDASENTTAIVSTNFRTANPPATSQAETRRRRDRRIRSSIGRSMFA